MKRSPAEHLSITLKGIMMGAADIIPGVSGGTIAFITGIYTELLDSIRIIPVAIKNLLKHKSIARFWQEINGNFLVALGSGIVIAVLLLSRLIIFLLVNYPVMIWSFFFGLILASAYIILIKIRKLRPVTILSFIAGTIIAYFVTVATPAATPETYSFIFISGFIAICAMILPGISGSFILLLFSKYEFILQSIHEINIPVLAVFAIGCILGLLLFSHVLSWMLHKYHDLSIALLSGFMIGSLNKVWPWKSVLATYQNSKGEIKPLIEKNVWPYEYATLSEVEKLELGITAKDPQLWYALLLALIGIIFIIVIDKFAKGKAIRA